MRRVLCGMMLGMIALLGGCGGVDNTAVAPKDPAPPPAKTPDTPTTSTSAAIPP